MNHDGYFQTLTFVNGPQEEIMNTTQLLIFPRSKVVKEKFRLILERNDELWTVSNSSSLDSLEQFAVKFESVECALDTAQFSLGGGRWFAFL